MAGRTLSCMENQRGGITILLAIVMAAIIALVGAIVDGGRMRSAGSQTERAVQNGVLSALADYDGKLQSDYGLFALAETNPENLKELISDYINKNLLTGLGIGSGDIPESKAGGYFNLFDFSLRKLQVQPVFNLTENSVLKREILQFMKYRAPKSLLEAGLGTLSDSRVEEVEKLCGTSAALSRKLELDQRSEELGLAQGALSERLEALSEEGESDRHQRAAREYMAAAVAAIDEPENAELRKLAQSTFERFSEGLLRVEGILAGCADAVNRVMRAKGLLDAEVRKAEARLAEDEYQLEEGFVETFKQDMELARKSLEEDNAGDVLPSIQEKLGEVRDVSEKAKTLHGRMEYFEESASFSASLDETMGGLFASNLQEPSTFHMDYRYMTLDQWATEGEAGWMDSSGGKDSGSQTGVVAKTGEVEDPRNHTYKLMDEIMGRNPEKEYNIISREEQKLLPSYESGGNYPNKMVTMEVSERDGIGNSPIQALNLAGGNFSLGENGKYEGGDLDSSRSALSSMAGLKDVIGGSLTGLRDVLYVNEYVMGTLNSAVPQLKKSMNGGAPEVTADGTIDLRGRIKGVDRKAFFNAGEVEYLLFGNGDEALNERMVKSSLLMVRFSANSITLHGNKERVARAQGLAVSLLGSIAVVTGGASASFLPAVREGILCAWAMSEAALDVKYLMEGRYIPLFKNIAGGHWLSDYPMREEALDRAEDAPSAFSYHDYLRIFLLLESAPQLPSAKLDRLGDLIQLNQRTGGREDFLLSQYNTGIHVKTEVTTGLFFLSSDFMPGSRSTGPDDAIIRTEFYKGY